MLTTAGLVFSTRVVKSGKLELAACEKLLTLPSKLSRPIFKNRKIPKNENRKKSFKLDNFKIYSTFNLLKKYWIVSLGTHPPIYIGLLPLRPIF